MRTRRRLLGSKASFQKGPHLVCEAKIAFRFNDLTDFPITMGEILSNLKLTLWILHIHFWAASSRISITL